MCVCVCQKGNSVDESCAREWKQYIGINNSVSRVRACHTASICLPVCKGSRCIIRWQTRCNMYRVIWCMHNKTSEHRIKSHTYKFLYALIRFPAQFFFSFFLYTIMSYVPLCLLQSFVYITTTGGETMAHSYLNYFWWNGIVCLVIR